LNDQDLLKKSIDSKTKLVWLETPTNPLLKVFDIEKVAKIAHEKGAIVLVDNTFASPYLQQPLGLGADIVMHSSTKYLGGHSDLIGGALMTNNKDLADQLYFIQKSAGAVPSPMDCFLMLRSTKTLAIRMEAHCKNAAILADFLNARDDIERVLYPGLASDPGHAIAKKQMRLFGGMISAELAGGLERSKRFFKKLKIFSLAESLGGVESLTEHPALMTHATIPADQRAATGITDGLVRFSVGLEDVEDLRADLEQALDGSK